ncbi:MAG: hypothetical protein QFF03_02635, partial [Pseudomonadota bacterium]|nr:hypothetical protein [Pseudomonadota bacterium]
MKQSQTAAQPMKADQARSYIATTLAYVKRDDNTMKNAKFAIALAHPRARVGNNVGALTASDDYGLWQGWCGWRGSNPRPLASEANT